VAATRPTIDDVKAAIGADTLASIADHNGDHVIDDAVVDGALEDGWDLALSFCDGELPIPDPTPRALKRAVIAIAVNDMRESRDVGTEGSRLQFSQAMKWLQNISDGKATLKPTVSTDPVDGSDPGDPEADGTGRVWSRESARWVF
jgi:phage gp36-like protein